MSFKGILRTLFYMLLGGVSFWTPDIIIHALRTYEFSNRDVSIITWLLPVTLLACYGIVFWWLDKGRKAPLIAIPMLAGVWLFGSTAMMIGASYSGGGFSSSQADAWHVIALGLFPPYTYIMAAYDGSFEALLIASMLMFVMCFIDKKRSLV